MNRPELLSKYLWLLKLQLAEFQKRKGSDNRKKMVKHLKEDISLVEEWIKELEGEDE